MRAPPPAAVLLLLATATAARAQVVRGRVLDNASGDAVSGARVEAFAGSRPGGRTRTAADGKFEMRLRAGGTFHIQAEREGYRSSVTHDIPVAARETVYVEVRVAAAPMQLDPLRVTARVAPPHRRSLELNGFYERERMGIGRFIRREDFENRSNLTTAQIVAREPGTVRIGQGPGEYIVFSRSSNVGAYMRRGAGYCIPQLYLDGMKINSGKDLSWVTGPNQVEAIELYSSAAEIPVQYNGINSACGVILVWTRHEP
jgi:hypothetical protein